MSEEEEGGGWRGPCDAPGCKDPTKSSRFRPAKKPEHHGKQCCARRKCMEWAGHRDLEKEKSARTAAKEAAKAATAAATAAQTRCKGLAAAAMARKGLVRIFEHTHKNTERESVNAFVYRYLACVFK